MLNQPVYPQALRCHPDISIERPIKKIQKTVLSVEKREEEKARYLN
jgi:hypothetical protein